MEIVRIGAPGDQEWDRYVRSHPEGSVFHESAWTRALGEAYPQHEPLLLAANDDGKRVGVLPLFRVKSLLFGSRLVSTAFGIYGGILADHPRAADALGAAAGAIAAKMRARWVELRSRRALLAGAPVKDLYVTFRIPIAPTFEATLKALPKKMRQDLRRLDERKEFTFVEDVPTEKFYELYLHTLRFHGTPPFALRWFDSLRAALGPRCVMLGAMHDGRLVGATMLVIERDSIMPLYTGVPRENYSLRTLPALHAREIRMCCERGLPVLDLGRSKKGTGAFDAKSHWGIEPVPLGYQYLLPEGRAMPDLSPTNKGFAPLIAMWKRLPLAATKLLGPALNAQLA